MTNKNWRDIAEIVGIVSIVAGLILVAWEVRQANNIAKTQMVMDLASQANEFNSATFENPEVANLVIAAYDPNYTDYTGTQASMMGAVAWHFSNIFWSAQRAYDNGLLSDDDIQMYQSSVAWHIENFPGMRPGWRSVYNTAPWLREMYVFEPLVEFVCGSKEPCGDLPPEE
jgi:hypothetical protein